MINDNQYPVRLIKMLVTSENNENIKFNCISIFNYSKNHIIILAVDVLYNL